MRKLLFLWLSTLVVLTSCQKKAVPDPRFIDPPYEQEERSERAYEKVTPNEEIKMNSNVINVKKDINQFLIKATPESNRIEYRYNAVLDQIKVGDVLYSSGQHSLDEAYAVKVKQIVRQGDKLIVETESTEMNDVFSEFEQKGEFVFNPKGEAELFDVEAQLNDPQLRAFTSTEHRFRSEKIKIIPKTKRGSITFKDGDATITYPLIDLDEDYKTKKDQLLLTLKVKRKKNPFHSMTYSAKNAYFAMIGQMEYEYHIDFTYGFEVKADSTINITDNTGKVVGKVLPDKYKSMLSEQAIYLMKTKKKEKIDPKLAHELGRIGKKRILLASLPLKLKSPSDLLIEPRIYIFLEFNGTIDGKIWIHMEYKPVVIDYHIELSALTRNVFKVGLSPIIKPSFQNFELNGKISGEAKVGVKAMLSMDFLPAIREEKKETASNYIGVYGDLYLQERISADAKISKENVSWDSGALSLDDCTGSIMVDINAGAYFSSGLEVRANLFKSKNKFEYNKEFSDPVSILPSDLRIKCGRIFMDGGTTFTLKDKDGEAAFWALPHTIKSSMPQVASTIYDAVKKEAVIHADREGWTKLSAEFPEGKFRWAWLWVTVRQSKSQVNGTIDISKGEQL